MEEIPKRDKSPIELEFDERMERRRQTLRKYRSCLALEPDAEAAETMERIREEYPDKALVAEYGFYKKMMDRLYDELAEYMGGYGQCEGRLMTDGRHVIICCCETLRNAIGNGLVSTLGDTISVIRRQTVVGDGDGGRYVISESWQPERTDYCPFCGAHAIYYADQGPEDD